MNAEKLKERLKKALDYMNEPNYGESDIRAANYYQGQLVIEELLQDIEKVF